MNCFWLTKDCKIGSAKKVSTSFVAEEVTRKKFIGNSDAKNKCIE